MQNWVSTLKVLVVQDLYCYERTIKLRSCKEWLGWGKKFAWARISKNYFNILRVALVPSHKWFTTSRIQPLLCEKGSNTPKYLNWLFCTDKLDKQLLSWQTIICYFKKVLDSSMWECAMSVDHYMQTLIVPVPVGLASGNPAWIREWFLQHH